MEALELPSELAQRRHCVECVSAGSKSQVKRGMVGQLVKNEVQTVESFDALFWRRTTERNCKQYQPEGHRVSRLCPPS
jgi:hypothetical protein